MSRKFFLTIIRKYSIIRNMHNDKFKPNKIHVLTGDDQIKGYTHPTRIFLLQMLAKEPRTISSVAKELGVHPANITHHFKLLEKVGLVLLVEKRDTGKNLEKYYRAIAYTFSINPSNNDIKNKKALALNIVKNDLSVAVNAIKEDDSREMIALLATARIDQAQVKQFIGKLENLIKDFQANDSKRGTVYNINLSLYPNDVDCLGHDEVRLT